MYKGLDIITNKVQVYRCTRGWISLLTRYRCTLLMYKGLDIITNKVQVYSLVREIVNVRH